MMKLRTILFFLALIICNRSTIYGQNGQSYLEKYDLDFMKFGSSKDSWAGGSVAVSRDFMYSRKDSVIKVYGLNSVALPLNFHLWKSIRLPHNPKKTLEIRARVSFPTADSISMVIHRLTKDQSLLRSDTTIRRSPFNLNKDSVQILTMCSEFSDDSTSDIQIHLVAHLPKVVSYIADKGSKREATGTLYGVDVLVDGKSIRTQEVKPVSAVQLKENYPIQTLGEIDSLNFSQLKVLNKHRIISLGETMHFNPAVKSAMQSLGLHLVKDNGASLILSENSLATSLMKNRYINDESYEIAPEFIDPLDINILKALRAERLRQRRKLHYLSFDIASSSDGLVLDICTFLFSLPQWSSNLALCRLVDKLKGNPTLDGALEVIRKYRKELLEVLYEEEVNIIEYMLRQNANLPRGRFERMCLRDKYMSENVRFFANLLSPDKHRPILLYGHLAHLGGRPTMLSVAVKPCGAYLKEQYGEDYYVIAMLTEGGETKVDKGFFGWGSEAVATMPSGTFEAVLAERSNLPYFMEIPKSWDRVHEGRLTGTSPSNSPNPHAYNLYNQAQGLFFLPGRAMSEIEKQAIRDESQDIALNMRMLRTQKEGLELARKKISDAEKR